MSNSVTVNYVIRVIFMNQLITEADSNFHFKNVDLLIVYCSNSVIIQLIFLHMHSNLSFKNSGKQLPVTFFFTQMTQSLITLADDACELKVNSSAFFLSINKTWSSVYEPCTLYKCIKTDGETRIDIQQLSCNIECPDDFIYKPVPSECCGKCFSKFCSSNEKKFNAGDIWKSGDNCTVNECIDTGLALVVNSYQKNCPRLKNCPQENIEIRDCCPYCNHRAQSEFCASRNHRENFSNFNLIQDTSKKLIQSN